MPRPPMSEVSPAAQRLPPDARRRQLIDVARALVEAQGPGALSMEGVAAAADVSRALVYKYFDNRAGLVRALWDEVAALWDVEPMPPVETLLADHTPEQLLDERLVGNTRWYFDQIERGGLLYYRLMSEPGLEADVEGVRRRVHDDNVRWWADLLAAMGIDADRALVFSSIFNGATEQMWGLIARGDVERAVIEETFFTSVRAALDRLRVDAGLAPLSRS